MNYPGFFETASALLVGLLVAVVLSDQRHRPDQVQGASPAADRRGALIVASLAVVLATGEFASMYALFIGHGTGALRWIVLSSIVLSTTGALARALESILRAGVKSEEVRRRTWDRSTASIALGGVATLILSTSLVVSSLNSPVPPGSLNTPKQYRVYGTCAAGSCGLNRRARPTTQSLVVGTRLHDGDIVAVICQTSGGVISEDPGHTSRQWDQLRDGSFVTDLFVSTPKRGAVSAGLQRCPLHAIHSSPTG